MSYDRHSLHCMFANCDLGLGYANIMSVQYIVWACAKTKNPIPTVNSLVMSIVEVHCELHDCLFINSNPLYYDFNSIITMANIAHTIDASIASVLQQVRIANAKISTMTLAFKLSSNIDLSVLLREYKDSTQWHKHCAAIGETATVREPGEKKNRKSLFVSFKNSISVLFMRGKRKVCIKSFSNGKLQVTGCNTVVEAAQIVDRFCMLLKECGLPLLTTLEISVQMFNVCFQLEKRVNLADLQNYLRQRNVTCFYDRDVYSGIKIKQETGASKLTILGFSSGNFILAGMKQPNDVMQLSPILCSLYSF